MEGQCCPVCKADWVIAVNSDAIGEPDKPLKLTCKVDGIQVNPNNVRWVAKQGKSDIDFTKKQKKLFGFSKDRLILTIKKMSAEMEG